MGNIAVADLPATLSWLNTEGLPRVAALAGKCFGEGAIGAAQDLLIYRALVVQYEWAAGLTHQEVHRDGSLLTCVVTLNDQHEYEGGGTYIEDLGYALAPPAGHAVLQAAALRHAGHFISSGERWVLVLFLISAEMREGEHIRLLKARAQRLSDEGDEAGEMHLLNLARDLCEDCDHELLFDQAVSEHERGNLEVALALYEQADSIALGRDHRVTTNLAAVRAELRIDGTLDGADSQCNFEDWLARGSLPYRNWLMASHLC